jgi:hypothetical protein
MTRELNSGSAQVHPFFDPRSTYRLLTQDSFWADGGQRSVRAFFERLRRRALEERQLLVPSRSPEWEGSPNANRVVRDYRSAVRRSANAAEKGNLEKARRAHLAGMAPARCAPGGPCPVLLTFDLKLPVQARGRLTEPSWLFPGIGEQEPPEIRHFPFKQTGLEPDRRCLVLLLEEEVLDRLQKNLSQPANVPAAAESPEDIIYRALAEAAPSRPDTEARRRADRLQEVWACVEGLELTTDKNGWLKGQVDLIRPSRLDPRTRVVLCLGPEAA